MTFSTAFKDQVVKQALNADLPQKLIAGNAGIGYSTLQKWLSEYRQSGDHPLSAVEKRPQDWSPEERLNALIETGQMDPQTLAAWCRQKGLYSHHLDQWRKALLTNNPDGSNANATRAYSRQLQSENKALKKELRRKDKALAETSALLVLKKKAHLIWGDDEDN